MEQWVKGSVQEENVRVTTVHKMDIKKVQQHILLEWAFSASCTSARMQM